MAAAAAAWARGATQASLPASLPATPPAPLAQRPCTPYSRRQPRRQQVSLHHRALPPEPPRCPRPAHAHPHRRADYGAATCLRLQKRPLVTSPDLSARICMPCVYHVSRPADRLLFQVNTSLLQQPVQRCPSASRPTCTMPADSDSHMSSPRRCLPLHSRHTPPRMASLLHEKDVRTAP